MPLFCPVLSLTKWSHTCPGCLLTLTGKRLSAHTTLPLTVIRCISLPPLLWSSQVRVPPNPQCEQVLQTSPCGHSWVSQDGSDAINLPSRCHLPVRGVGRAPAPPTPFISPACSPFLPVLFFLFVTQAPVIKLSLFPAPMCVA